jgi:hypothetical protein
MAWQRPRFAPLVLAALVGAGGTSASASAADPAPPCGFSVTDWCPSPPGDPCGRHRDERACRADPRCHGIKYRGESVVACSADGTGFWSNCPAVGCVSR